MAAPIFSRPQPPKRTDANRFIQVRVALGEFEVLSDMAARLGVSRAEMARQALDFWIAKDPAAKAAFQAAQAEAGQ